LVYFVEGYARRHHLENIFTIKTTWKVIKNTYIRIHMFFSIDLQGKKEVFPEAYRVMRRGGSYIVWTIG
jgi:hypothetical protein